MVKLEFKNNDALVAKLIERLTKLPELDINSRAGKLILNSCEKLITINEPLGLNMLVEVIRNNPSFAKAIKNAHIAVILFNIFERQLTAASPVATDIILTN